MKVIFTNGCFDMIHRMHVELLRFCKSRGDKVVVGLNSDSSVKRLKGDTRPIFNQEDRKFVLEAFESVGEVIIFDEDTPYELIKELKPDEIVKGGDYEENEVVGNDIAKVVLFNYIEKYSTTNTLSSLQKDIIL
jgi:D-beta-D-heptose 7-phosphate kinase/D-beta-D-heptose 1-phosphate adenosyltransferase|tara:strand:- start:5128 stop:5529 length:402 start_codon:yes stop_codon:yes gene_type:complete